MEHQKSMFIDIELSNYKGVLIDLDDTLYLYDPCHEVAKKAMLDLICQRFGITLEVANSHYTQARARVHKNLKGQAASHSRLLYAKCMVEDIDGRCKAQLILNLEEAYWNAFLSEMIIHPEALSFLDQCNIQNKKLAIVTDLTTQIQLRKFEKLGLSKWINFMVTSEEAGVEKPKARPFQIALDLLELDANEVVMVGDNINKDKLGAEKIGVKWFHPFE